MCAQIAGRRNSCRFLALTATIIPSLCFFASAALLQPRGYALAKHCTLGSAREGETVASIAASKPHFPRSASSDSSERGAAAEALSDRRSEQHAGANFREHTARPSAAGSCAESFSAETGLAAATPRPRLFGRLNDAGSEGDASALRIFPVLLAGGVGRRFGGAEPKQFLPLVGEADAASISLSKLLALGRNCESQLSPPECVAVVARTKFRKRFAQVLVKTTKRLEVSPPPSASEGSEAREKSVSKGLVFANPGVERWESSWSATEEICRLLLREAGCGDEEAETERELSGGREIQDSPSSRRRRAEFYLRSLKAPPPPLPTQRASSEDTGICGKRPLLERAFVLFHDAARPCFSVTATEAAVRAAASGGAAVVCERATDSLKLADDSGVYAHLPRHHCFHAQTPQVIRLDLLLRAFAELFRLLERQQELLKKLRNGNQLSTKDARMLARIQDLLSSVTDDVSLLGLLPRSDQVPTPEFSIKVCISPRANPKITYCPDMQRAEQALRQELGAGEAESWQSLLQEVL